MGDEFQLGNGSWWEASSRNRFETGATPVTSTIPTRLNALASFGWPTEMVDMKSRSSLDSAAASPAGSMVLQGGGHDDIDQSSGGGGGGRGGGGGGVLSNPSLQMMGLGLSSPSMDWNHALLSEKGGGSFRSLLQDDLAADGGEFQPESGGAASSHEHWRQKQQFNSQVDSAAAYGLLLSEHQQNSGYQNRPMSNYPYPTAAVGGGYGAETMPSMNKYPPFLRTSPPKQAAAAAAGSNHLHFTNNTPFWNAAAPPAAMNDAQSSFFPPLQTQIPTAQSFDAKPKTKSEGRDSSGATKRSTTETPSKRPRSETASPLAAFKVRKEKMGDRITALQQLVSPFGKTDTASVLSEAIEYIKFLHEQVNALSAPYMKNGAAMQIQQNMNADKSKDPEGPRQDLRSRGLCLVPVSSTFPVTHETAVDFWTPTFGGTFR